MHLARTSSEEGTVPTWLSTKGLGGNLPVCSYAYKIEKLYVFSFLFVHGLHFGSTHACDFLCNSCGLEVKEWVFWRRPKSAGGGRGILQFVVVLVFIPLSLVFVRLLVCFCKKHGVEFWWGMHINRGPLKTKWAPLFLQSNAASFLLSGWHWTLSLSFICLSPYQDTSTSCHTQRSFQFTPRGTVSSPHFKDEKTKV